LYGVANDMWIASCRCQLRHAIYRCHLWFHTKLKLKALRSQLRHESRRYHLWYVSHTCHLRFIKICYISKYFFHGVTLPFFSFTMLKIKLNNYFISGIHSLIKGFFLPYLFSTIIQLLLIDYQSPLKFLNKKFPWNLLVWYVIIFQ
jgi:hypothetical protein